MKTDGIVIAETRGDRAPEPHMWHKGQPPYPGAYWIRVERTGLMTGEARAFLAVITWESKGWDAQVSPKRETEKEGEYAITASFSAEYVLRAHIPKLNLTLDDFEKDVVAYWYLPEPPVDDLGALAAAELGVTEGQGVTDGNA